MSILCYRALALLLLGYPDTALTDADRAVKNARDIGQAATLMFALVHACLPIFVRKLVAANAQLLMNFLL